MKPYRLALWSFFALAGCEPQDGDSGDADGWQTVHEDLPGALLSVWGTSHNDVWTVGADARDGDGPLLLHYDGTTWTRVATGLTQGDLWWVFGFEGGPMYMGGDGGVIVRKDGDTFTTMTTPGTGTVFGIWGADPSNVWAVGGETPDNGGFAWRLVGDAWEPEPSLPADVDANAAVWKMYGASSDDAWAVGSNGLALHWDGAAFSPGDTGVGTSLFTVHESNGRYVAVGGTASGFILENDGSAWTNVTPTDAPPMGLAGVSLGEDDAGVAVGTFGTIYVRDTNGWHIENAGLRVRQNLHGSWIDDEGGLWVVGGQTLVPPLTEGILIHRGVAVPTGDLE